MSQAKFKTVLWDVGGVLLTNGWDHNERKAVFDAFQFEEREEFERRHEEENDAWEKGAIDFDEYLTRTLFFKPRPFGLEAIKKAIEDQSLVLEDSAMPLLKELHAKGGVLMGQLNNESRELNDVRLDRFGLREYLSVFLCSGYVNLRKPDPAIYRLGAEVLQKKPAEIVFIDDREKNVQEAAGFGFHAIQYKGSASLRAALEDLELL
ncbi:MAG TPA: HAD-IA family hydrolase [Acidobacteriaceae bacterium]